MYRVILTKSMSAVDPLHISVKNFFLIKFIIINIRLYRGNIDECNEKDIIINIERVGYR